MMGNEVPPISRKPSYKLDGNHFYKGDFAIAIREMSKMQSHVQ